MGFPRQTHLERYARLCGQLERAHEHLIQLKAALAAAKGGYETVSLECEQLHTENEKLRKEVRYLKEQLNIIEMSLKILSSIR